MTSAMVEAGARALWNADAQAIRMDAEWLWPRVAPEYRKRVEPALRAALAA